MEFVEACPSRWHATAMQAASRKGSRCSPMYAARHQDLIAGIVLVDSAHVQQYNHYAAISPAIAERYATQDSRFDRDAFLQAAGQLTSGEHLKWHLDVPLIVLEHKRLSGPPNTEQDRLAVDWHQLQVDLAGRSRFGKLIEAHGHMMATEQPEIVVQSIRDVITQAAALTGRESQH